MKQPPQPYDARGRRLYMTEAECRAFIAAAAHAPGSWRTLSHVLAFTGCRNAEALALTAAHIDLTAGLIAFEKSHRRTANIVRTVPVPGAVLEDLEDVHNIRSAQRAPDRGLSVALWPWSKVTAWNRITRIIELSGIEAGPHACPKGLRHGFALHAINNGVPLHIIQKWLGHNSIHGTKHAYARDERLPRRRRPLTPREERKLSNRLWDSLCDPPRG